MLVPLLAWHACSLGLHWITALEHKIVSSGQVPIPEHFWQQFLSFWASASSSGGVLEAGITSMLSLIVGRERASRGERGMWRRAAAPPPQAAHVATSTAPRAAQAGAAVTADAIKLAAEAGAYSGNLAVPASPHAAGSGASAGSQAGSRASAAAKGAASAAVPAALGALQARRQAAEASLAVAVRAWEESATSPHRTGPLTWEASGRAGRLERAGVRLQGVLAAMHGPPGDNLLRALLTFYHALARCQGLAHTGGAFPGADARALPCDPTLVGQDAAVRSLPQPAAGTACAPAPEASPNPVLTPSTNPIRAVLVALAGACRLGMPAVAADAVGAVLACARSSLTCSSKLGARQPPGCDAGAPLAEDGQGMPVRLAAQGCWADCAGRPLQRSTGLRERLTQRDADFQEHFALFRRRCAASARAADAAARGAAKMSADAAAGGPPAASAVALLQALGARQNTEARQERPAQQEGLHDADPRQALSGQVDRQALTTAVAAADSSGRQGERLHDADAQQALLGQAGQQALTAAMVAANSRGGSAGAVTWLDLGLERLSSLGGALGGPLLACTALVDLAAAANQLTSMHGAARLFLTCISIARRVSCTLLTPAYTVCCQHDCAIALM